MSSAQEIRPGQEELSAFGTAKDATNVTVNVVLGKESVSEIRVPTRTDLVETRVGFHVEEGPITIGEALESVADKIGDKPLTVSDARAIQSAELKATGIPSGVKGGPAAQALSAVDQARSRDPSRTTADVTMGEVLEDATLKLPVDKVVTPFDAAAVHSAEARNNDGEVVKGGVTASLQQAATHNQNAGFLPGADGFTKVAMNKI